MNPCPFLVIALLLWTNGAHAFPEAIARKILERPEEFDSGPLGEVAEAIIRGAGGIEELSLEVGEPSVALNVLAVKPRDYGFKVTGSVQEGDDGNGSFKFNIASNTSPAWFEKHFDQLPTVIQQKIGEGDGEEGLAALEPGAVIEMIEVVARLSGEEVRAKSQTIFLLNGFGASNRVSLGWAMVLAKNGYQVIAPDLRGLGKSGGRGPTYGKHEVEDLRHLLTSLQAKGRIGEREPVAVMGVSYGAGIASLWTANDPRVKATVLFAPYAQADETISSAAATLKEELNFPFSVNPESVRRGTARAARRLRISWEEVAPAQAVSSIGHPILFLTSTGDEIIPPSVVAKLHQSAPEGSTLRTLERLPHELLGLYLEEIESDVLGYLGGRLQLPAQP